MNRARWFLLAVVVAALWPVWRWYALRLGNGSDEPWGLLALAAAAVCVAANWRSASPAPRTMAAAMLLLGYAATFHFVPPLARAILAVSALALLLGCKAGAAGIHGLFILSLPVVATLQFYLGYPMRVVAAEVSRGCLRLGGFEIVREGTVLTWAGDALLVDAPCSGVQMLWAGLFLACLFAAHQRLSWGRTLVAVSGATAIIVLANAARATALFFKESRLVTVPEWTHAGVGLLAFAGAAAGIIALAQRLASSRVALPPSTAQTSSAQPWRRALLPVAAAFAALVAFLPRPQAECAAVARAMEWPADFDGAPLQEVPLTAREAQFSAGFPGRVARFTDGERAFIFRAVHAPTRKLHSSADCFRALGYRVTSEAPLLDERGRRWAQFTATNEVCRLQLRERITDASGGEWTDVSAWFWLALGNRSSRPWLAVTVIVGER